MRIFRKFFSRFVLCVITTLFLSLIEGGFLLAKQPENLDPSYKMDLDFSDCFGRLKLIWFIQHF